jgi:sialic acid synthase SpsE
VLLHCVPRYPTPPDEANLRLMQTLKKRFRLPVGFSDHTLGYNVTTAAVALGAVAVEKHITLSRKLEGPDHAFALEPDELKLMVKAIRAVEKSLGDGKMKQPGAKEKEFIAAVQVKLVAARDIAQGARIERAMLAYRRAPGGITPADEARVLGATAAAPIAAGTPLAWDKLRTSEDADG